MALLLDRLVDDPRWLARAPAQVRLHLPYISPISSYISPIHPAQVRGVLGAAPGGAAEPVRSQRRARALVSLVHMTHSAAVDAKMDVENVAHGYILQCAVDAHGLSAGWYVVSKLFNHVSCRN